MPAAVVDRVAVAVVNYSEGLEPQGKETMVERVLILGLFLTHMAVAVVAPEVLAQMLLTRSMRAYLRLVVPALEVQFEVAIPFTQLAALAAVALAAQLIQETAGTEVAPASL